MSVERRWRRLRTAWAAPASLVFGALAFGRPARADAADVDLTWDAPPECPDSTFVLSRVREIVGSNAPVETNVEARARIAKRSTYELTITTRRGRVVETRSAESSSCAALAEAAAIIVALAVDPARGPDVPRTDEVSQDRPPTPNEPSSEQGTSGEPKLSKDGHAGPPARPEPARPNDAQKDSWPGRSFGLRAGLVFDVGTLPKPALGFDGRAIAVLGPLQLGLGGELMAEVRETYSAATGAGARFNLFDIGAFACFAPSSGRWRFGACAAADATWMEIEGLDIRQPSSTTLRWPTLRIGALGEYRFARSAIAFARADTLVAFGVPPVVLTTATSDVVLHEVSVPAIRLSLGLRTDIF